MAIRCLRASSRRSLRLPADEAAGRFRQRRSQGIPKVGYEFDGQHGSHIILRHANPPHRRLSIPNHKELAKGTLQALIREAGSRWTNSHDFCKIVLNGGRKHRSPASFLCWKHVRFAFYAIFTTLKRESANWRWLRQWRSPARLAFWRQFEPDKLVATLLCRIDRRHESFRMLFEQTNVVCAENDKSQLSAFQILLTFKTLIRRDHYFKPGVFCCAQKIAVYQPSPAQILSRADVVFLEIPQERVRDVLIKKYAQIAGSRRTVLRLRPGVAQSDRPSPHRPATFHRRDYPAPPEPAYAALL